MNKRIRNPHTFDMSDYFSGIVYVVGGRDFEAEENEKIIEKNTLRDEKKIELDWSFLKKNLVQSARPKFL
jgi:hypothetical protein